MRHVAE